jgi:ribosomal protein S12 methylthiotransferase
MRGKHRSTPIEDLVLQAKNLAKNGTKELILIAQDLTYYGLDLYRERKLADLLRMLSDVDGIEWIRLHYAFPSGFPMEVLDVMKERDNICKYLDMPLQHATTNMLKAMKRGITREKTDALIQDIRSRIPEIALRTTLISGFPGETEADFEEMLRWVESSRFDRLGIFTYSHEEDTSAFALTDDVPMELKKERAEAVMEAQSHISLELNQARIGQQYKVLIDRVEGNNFIGRTEFDSPEVDNEVLIPLDKNTYVRVGDFCQVKITSAGHYDLGAEVL